MTRQTLQNGDEVGVENTPHLVAIHQLNEAVKVETKVLEPQISQRQRLGMEARLMKALLSDKGASYSELCDYVLDIVGREREQMATFIAENLSAEELRKDCESWEEATK